jgi:hypothetical protein
MFHPFNICGFAYLAKATKLMFAAFTISSTEKSKRMAFLLETRP